MSAPLALAVSRAVFDDIRLARVNTFWVPTEGRALAAGDRLHFTNGGLSILSEVVEVQQSDDSQYSKSKWSSLIVIRIVGVP